MSSPTSPKSSSRKPMTNGSADAKSSSRKPKANGSADAKSSSGKPKANSPADAKSSSGKPKANSPADAKSSSGKPKANSPADAKSSSGKPKANSPADAKSSSGKPKANSPADAKSSSGKRTANDSADTGASISKVKRRKYSRKFQHVKESICNLDEPWSILEKEKLLEALRTYSPTSIESISKHVGSKTAEQVGAKIANIRESKSLKNSNRTLQDGEFKSKAPLETWILLAHELVAHEPADLSENLSDVMGIIGRNATPRRSIHPKLNWRNIYQYVSDLLQDRVQLQPLTDLESYVVLDLMHDMANTLRGLETEKQAEIMKMKYKLMRMDPLCFPQASNKDELVAMALSNDFSLLEKDATTTSATATTTAASQPSTSSGAGMTVESNTSETGEQIPEPIDSSSQEDSTMTHRLQPSVVTDSPQNSSTSFTATTTAATTTTATLPTETHSEITSSHGLTNNATSSNGHVISQTNTNDHYSPPRIDDAGSSTETQQIPPNMTAWTPENGYSRPRYFTMNPFCIPWEMIDFKPKQS